MTKTGKRAKVGRLGNGGGRGAIGRRAVAVFGLVAALTGATLGAPNDDGGDWANWEKGNGDVAALEEAFFEALGRCESPLLVERDEAENALFERFAEFEPIWQDRRFLTNGEIGAEARQRFELAEARYREKASNDCVAAFETTFEAVALEVAEKEERSGGKKNDEPNGRNAGNGESAQNSEEAENDESAGNGEFLRGRVRLRWGSPLRIVYLVPDWSAFERRDAAGKRWRPSGRFSAPELAPEFDASTLTLETTWERVDAGEKTALNGEKEENGENAANGEGKTTVVGAFEGLIGGDFRVWLLPLGRGALKKSVEENDREKKNGEDGETATTRQTLEPNVDFSSVFQSGDAVATVGETTMKENGETTVRVRLEFAEAFDAFDSHRVWCEQGDFALIIDAGDDKAGASDVFDVSDAENESRTKTKADEEAEADAKRKRWSPIRLRVRERSANGALFELDFPNDAALREAVAAGRARLACRVPRFFFWTRFNVEGTEKGNDEKTFNVDAAEILGNAADVEND
jgi:hypothetical protein